MREILFRGKRVDNGEWVYGYFVKKLDPLLLTEMCFILVQEYDTSCIDGTPTVLKSEMTWYRVIPSTIGQYTGLTDKNGIKIFEGDIVKAKITENKLTHTKKYEGIYTVKYHDKYCYFYLAKQGNNLLFDGNWDYFLSNIEVVGNIHDNPELLKECEGK